MGRLFMSVIGSSRTQLGLLYAHLDIGAIGMEFGNGAYNTMDNGILRFDQVRIPRNQMLMWFVQRLAFSHGAF